jgi:hypothetical protein
MKQSSSMSLLLYRLYGCLRDAHREPYCCAAKRNGGCVGFDGWVFLIGEVVMLFGYITRF